MCAWVSVQAGPYAFCCSRAILLECAIIWSQFWHNVSPDMKNLGRSGCVHVLWCKHTLLCFLSWGKQPVAVPELQVSLCLQRVLCLAAVQALQCMRAHLILKNKLERVGCSPVLLPLRGTQAQWWARAAQLGIQLWHCWDAQKALRTNQGTEHSRDLDAVVKEGCSDKAGGCDNQIWESYLLELILY